MLEQTHDHNKLIPPSNPDYPWVPGKWQVLCYYCAQPIYLTEPAAAFRQRASYGWRHRVPGLNKDEVNCNPEKLRPDNEIDDPRCHICGTQTDQHRSVCSAGGKPRPRATSMSDKESEVRCAFGHPPEEMSTEQLRAALRHADERIRTMGYDLDACQLIVSDAEIVVGELGQAADLYSPPISLARRIRLIADRQSPLFESGEFRLASGATSDFKIQCHMLTMADWQTIARLMKNRLPSFGSVEGVPTGGWILAEAMRQYANPDGDGPLLIVDDVCSTGGSMERFRAGRDAIGAVLFARGEVPGWVMPLYSQDAWKLRRDLRVATMAMPPDATDEDRLDWLMDRACQLENGEA